MRIRIVLVALLILAASLPVAMAQGDGCRGALDALNRVKEQITPRLSPETESGKRRLQIMQSALEKSTNNCKDESELWFYRMVVAERLNDPKDVKYAKGKIDDIAFEDHFDPFSLPPAATPPPPAKLLTAGTIRKKWALVVGIDDFEDARVPHLKYAVKDAKDFASFLDDPKGGGFDPSHVQVLANGQATLKGIRQALGKLRADAQPDDLVVLYFSGHGSPRALDPNGVSYIITHDTSLDDSATLYASSLQMIDLVQVLNRDIKAQHVVLLLDTCYSGDALTGSTVEAGSTRAIAIEASTAPTPQPFSAAFDNLKMGYGRAVLTASRANERSWESASLGNGYFTHFLLESLRTKSAHPDLSQLATEVQAKVSTRVRAEQGASQTPSFEFGTGGESIVLATPEKQ